MTKLKLKFAVTNKNIKLRFFAEKKKNPEFGFPDMAKLFGIKTPHGEFDRHVPWKWIQLKNHQRKPSHTFECPVCKKDQMTLVDEWLNDGTLSLTKKK